SSTSRPSASTMRPPSTGSGTARSAGSGTPRTPIARAGAPGRQRAPGGAQALGPAGSPRPRCTATPDAGAAGSRPRWAATPDAGAAGSRPRWAATPDAGAAGSRPRWAAAPDAGAAGSPRIRPASAPGAGASIASRHVSSRMDRTPLLPGLRGAIDSAGAAARPRFSGDAQDDLAEVLARLHRAMRLGDRVEREHAVHDRADATGGEVGAEALREGRHDRGLLLDRAGAQGRA